MELDRQLEVLINDAPNFGVPSLVVEQAVAPVLKLFADKLEHLEYYVLQNLEGDWVLTTIANPQLQQTIDVIYAFTSVKDAANFGGKSNSDLIAMPIPVTQLLFRLFSLQQVDSIIFLDDSQNLNRGVKIERSQLMNLIQQQLEGLNNLPPNLA